MNLETRLDKALFNWATAILALEESFKPVIEYKNTADDHDRVVDDIKKQ